MLDNILSIIAPHHCCGCDKIGTLLCDNCKNNITYEIKNECFACSRPSNATNICKNCATTYDRFWCVGERKGVLQRLIGNYKFKRVKSSYKPLGDLLLNVLPELPSNVVIVSVPTVQSHIRERGYDHIHLISNYVAKSRHLPYQKLIKRKSNTKQRQASAKKRDIQARSAFVLDEKVDNSKIYLLIDDVITTGATIKYAAKTLRDAGATDVWVAVLAKQIGGS